MQEAQINGMVFKYLVSKELNLYSTHLSLSLFQSFSFNLSLILSLSFPHSPAPSSLPHKDIEGARGWTKTNMQNDTLNHKTKIQNDITFTSTRLKFSKRQRPSAYSSDCTCTNAPCKAM